MKQVRYMSASAQGADGKLYVFGGFSLTGDGVSSECYDPLANTWTYIPPLPRPIYCCGCVGTPDHKIYLFGGGLGQELSLACYCYDLLTQTYTCLRDLPESFSDGSAAFLM